ncbi:MAG: TIGR01620 family protein [Pseudomonadota bacterium]
MRRKPVLIDIDDEPAPDPAAAPPLPDPDAKIPDAPVAMQQAAELAARRPSRLARLIWSALAGLVGLWLSIAIWDFVTSLIERQMVLGYVAAGLAGLVILGCVLAALREAAAFARLARIDQIQEAARSCLNAPDLVSAKKIVAQLERLFAARDDTSWGLAHLREQAPHQVDGDILLSLAETTLLAPLDRQAEREVSAAARQVATVTALVPLALADVAAALFANLRMIRRIAEIYGGRTGRLGTWRLTRSVMTHLVATGAVAVGDDMLSSVAGGGLLSKLSRRFGEGLVNGALTARVGVAAMEVCRPLPFYAEPRPSVRKLVQSALSDLFKGSAQRNETNTPS